MPLPTLAQVEAAEARFGSWEAAEDWAEQQPAMDTWNIWGREMTYTERVWTIIAPEFREPGSTVGGSTASGIQKRDPLPVPLVEMVLQLRCDDGKPWAAITAELEGGVSHRKIDYVRIALIHGNLGWYREAITFGPMTQNTAAGIVLPKR